MSQDLPREPEPPSLAQAPRFGSPAARLLARLGADDGQDLEALVSLAMDTVLGQPLGTLVTVETILAAVDLALGETAVALSIERYAGPAAAREHLRATESHEALAAWLPEAAVPVITELLRRPAALNPDIVKDLVDQGAVRTMLGAIVQEAILGFVQRSKLPGLSGAADLLGALGRRAGRGLLSGMGRELEKQLEHHVKEFLDQSMARLTGKLVELVGTEASQKLLGQMRADLLGKALKTSVSFYYGEIARLPFEDILPLVPPIIRHNLLRPELRAALRSEIEQALVAEMTRPLADLLSELGWLPEARALAVQAALPAARALARNPALLPLLERLLGNEDPKEIP